MLNFNNENWKPVVGYEKQYIVSIFGDIYGLVRKELKSSRTTTCSNYLYIKAYKNNKMKSLSVHRTVALAFIPNPMDKPQVNHIDGNKLNNNVCNLEWVTVSENLAHAHRTGLKQPSKSWLGKKVSNTSKYHNVSWDNSRKKWVGFVKHNKKVHFNKRFNTEKEAALHVNWILDELSLTDRPKNIIN